MTSSADDWMQRRCGLKLILIGDTSVGKSAILARYVHDQFDESFTSTIGVDLADKPNVLLSDGKTRVCLRIWDTAGQERFHTITKAYFRGAHGAVLVYDRTNRQSFRNIRKWYKDLQEQTDEMEWAEDKEGQEIRQRRKAIPIMILGNKSDLVKTTLPRAVVDSEYARQEIEDMRGQSSANNLAPLFFEISCKDNSPEARAQLDNAFRQFADVLHKERLKVAKTAANALSVSLQQSATEDKNWFKSFTQRCC